MSPVVSFPVGGPHHHGRHLSLRLEGNCGRLRGQNIIRRPATIVGPTRARKERTTQGAQHSGACPGDYRGQDWCHHPGAWQLDAGGRDQKIVTERRRRGASTRAAPISGGAGITESRRRSGGGSDGAAEAGLLSQEAGAAGITESGSDAIQAGLFSTVDETMAAFEAAAGVTLNAPVQTRGAGDRRKVVRIQAANSLTVGEQRRFDMTAVQ